MESMEEDGSNTMTAGVPSGHLEGELENVCRELALVDAKVAELLDTQTALQARRDQLSTEIQARQKRRERFAVHSDALFLQVVNQGCPCMHTYHDAA